MALASAGVKNLKNSSFCKPVSESFSPYAASAANLANLRELVDENNRVLGLFTPRTVSRQKVLRRAAAITPEDKKGRLVFRLVDDALDFAVYAPASPTLAAEDHIAALWPALAGTPRCLGVFSPCAENGLAFASVWLAPSTDVLPGDNYIFIERSGIKSMLARGYEFSPFLRQLILGGIV